MELNYKHAAQCTLSSDAAHVFDAVEASSSDAAGRLALPPVNGNHPSYVLFSASFPSECLYRCVRQIPLKEALRSTAWEGGEWVDNWMFM